ncbi:hypothetical protein MUP95_10460 [bacterium]|nr:hypothetical protein [bacterium]
MTDKCPKCDTELIHADDYHMSFSQGEITETGGEFLHCPGCGARYDYSMLVEDFGFVKEK